MKAHIIKAVQHYSNVMIEKDIDVVDSFKFNKCMSSSIEISTKYKLKFIINIEHESLIKLSNLLFGFYDLDLISDLQKEIVNTIGGYFADNYFNKGYNLSLPKIDNICDTKHAVFFRNEILDISIRLKVE